MGNTVVGFVLTLLLPALICGYPVYKDIDDIELANRALEKYPVYADRVQTKDN